VSSLSRAEDEALLGLLILKISASGIDPSLVDFAVESLVKEVKENKSATTNFGKHSSDKNFDSSGSSDDNGKNGGNTNVDTKTQSIYSDLLPKQSIPILLEEHCISHVRSVGSDCNTFHRGLIFEWCRHVIEAKGLTEKDREIIFNYMILSDGQLVELEDCAIAIREMLLWANMLKQCVIRADVQQLRAMFSAPSTDLFAVWICRQRNCMVFRDHLETKGLIAGQPNMTLKTFLELKGESPSTTMVDIVSLRKNPSHAALICASFAFLATINVISSAPHTIETGKVSDKTRSNLQKVTYVGTSDLYSAKAKARNKGGVASPTKLPTVNEVQKALSKVPPFTLNLFSDTRKSLFRILYHDDARPMSTAVSVYADSSRKIGSEQFDSVGHDSSDSSESDAEADAVLMPEKNAWKSDGMIAPYDYCDSSEFLLESSDFATDDGIERVDDKMVAASVNVSSERNSKLILVLRSLGISESSKSTTAKTDVWQPLGDAGSLNGELLFGTTVCSEKTAQDMDIETLNSSFDHNTVQKAPRIPTLEFLHRPKIPEIPSSSSSFLENSALSLVDPSSNNSDVPVATENCAIKHDSVIFAASAKSATRPNSPKRSTVDVVMEVPDHAGATTASDLLTISELGGRHDEKYVKVCALVAMFCVAVFVVIAVKDFSRGVPSITHSVDSSTNFGNEIDGNALVSDSTDTSNTTESISGNENTASYIDEEPVDETTVNEAVSGVGRNSLTEPTEQHMAEEPGQAMDSELEESGDSKFLCAEMKTDESTSQAGGCSCCCCIGWSCCSCLCSCLVLYLTALFKLSGTNEFTIPCVGGNEFTMQRFPEEHGQSGQACFFFHGGLFLSFDPLSWLMGGVIIFYLRSSSDTVDKIVETLSSVFVPKYWSGASSNGASPFSWKVVPVTSCDELKAIEGCLVHEGSSGGSDQVYGGGRTRFELAQAWRIEYLYLWNRYVDEQLRIIHTDLPILEKCGVRIPELKLRTGLVEACKEFPSQLKSEINEVYLLYGTKPKCVMEILDGRMRSAFCSLDFAEDIAKSDLYSNYKSTFNSTFSNVQSDPIPFELHKTLFDECNVLRPDENLFYVFICRVTAGYFESTTVERNKTTRGSMTMIGGVFPLVMHHAVVAEADAETARFREFSVGNSGRVYPEYLVAYRRI